MKRKIVLIVVFLTLVLTAFVIVLPNVSAQEPDFGIAAFPSSQTINPGGLATFLVTVTSLNGFNSPVTLEAIGLPDDTTASFNPNPVTPTGNSMLTITTTEGTPTGSFPITVTGTSGSLTHTAATAITVDFGLIPKKFGTFAGQVTDINTGESIEGAKVFVCKDSTYDYYYSIYPTGRYYSSPEIPVVTTDSDGYYTITGVPLNTNNAPKSWVIGFYADDYSGTYHTDTAIADIITTVDMELCHASIEGTIIYDTTGEPIEGAEIYAWSYASNSLGYVYYFYTDENGYYSLPNLPLTNDNEPRFYYIRASAPGYSNDLGQTKTTTISCGDSITLDFSFAFGTFAGQVIDADTGEPIEGAKVFVCKDYTYDYYYYINPTGRYYNYLALPEVTTDSDGYYTITGVPLNTNNAPRSWVIGFYADDFSGTYHTDTAIADTITTVDMELCQSGIIGWVIDATTGEPIEGAEIYAWSYASDSYGYVYYFYTDENGYYSLPNLPLANDNNPRTYNIQFTVQGYYDKTQTTSISCGDSTTLNFYLVPRLFGTFSGQVTDANTGEPIAGAKVFVCKDYTYNYYYYIYPSSRNYYYPEIPEVTTNSDGYYTITGVPLNTNNAPKSWVIGFYADDYSGTYHTDTVIADEITTVDMALCHAGIIGRVIDATTGEPIEGAKIYAWSYASNSVGYIDQYYTDETGFYSLPNLPLANDDEPRTYYVQASAQGYYDQTKLGTIFCGGIITIDFAGEIAFGTISGTVTSCITGEPMGGVFIGSSFGGFDYTDEMGMYTLTNVPLEVDGSPRTWEVTAQAGGVYEDQTKSVEVSADTTSILDFILCFNQPPVAIVNGPYTGFEGSPVDFSAIGSSDPEGDLLTYSWDLNGDGIYGDATGATTSYTWYDDYSGIISVKVSDGELTSTASTTVTVYNVAPDITYLTVDPGLVAVGETVTLDATFTDPGTLDTWTATIDWGDEITSDGTIDGYTVTGTHTYDEAGVYTVTLTVTDDDGGSDVEILFQYVVVYNPNVYIDIKPGSCPNPINYKDNGLLPVAICGTDDFDVTTIDPASIRLTRNSIEEYVTPVRWSYEDAATPYTGNEGCDDCCGCHTLIGDGYTDLSLKFKIQDVIKKLSLVLDSREQIPLTIIGNLKEEYYGTLIKVQDCLLVLFSKNVGIIDIISPFSGVPQTFTPEVTVKNFGSKKENNVPVNLIITTEGIIVYDKTVYVNINVGQTVHVIFQDWTPQGEGDIDYTITACTKLTGDEKPSNDCMSKIITIHFPILHDVGVTEIISPISGLSQTFIPEVTVENFGICDETNVPVEMEITQQITLFSDGFESFTLGFYDLPTGWTVQTTNPTGTWYMYASSNTYSASTYPRVQESGSDGNAQFESLISPVIDCSGLAAVRLSFTKSFYCSPFGDATFTLYGSDDGGSSWGYTLVTYSSTSSATETIDITSWATGQNDVRFKFEFVSSADASLNSYLYFDNMWVGNPTGDWGPYGDNPPEGWTIERYDTSAWDYNHWYRYSSSSYDMYGSSARIAYASPYPEVDDKLISPSIDCSALSTVILQFNCYFYAYTLYNNEGYVQVSIDGGPWQNVDDYRYTSPGSYGYSIWYEYYNGYDITALAAGHNNVKVRFHFTRPAGLTSGYWNLDNVRVSDGSGTFKFIETFDTGQAVYFTTFKNYIHDDWGGKWDWRPIREPYYNNKWLNVQTCSDPVCTPYEGLNMAQYYSNIYQGMKAMLYSFPINVAAANTLKMSFWMFHDAQVGAGSIDLLASHDGITWETMATFYRNDGTEGWVQHFVDLTGYEDDTALQIAFLGTSDYVAYMNIDDVEIFDQELIPEYSATVYVDINSGQTVQTFFPAWEPDPEHNLENVNVKYDVVAATNLVGDKVPSNDSSLKTFTINYPYFYDVELTSINSPITNGPVQTLPVQTTIKNVGQYPVCNFFVQVQIGLPIYSIDGYFNDFEADDGGFTKTGGQWAWGIPTSGPMGAYSGEKLWATNLGGNYAAGHATLTTDAIVVPVGGDLTFWHWYYFESSYDGYNVKISTDGGTTWSLIYPVGGYTGTANSANPLYPEPIYCGSHQTWEQATFDLASYEGQTVKFRFDMGADSSVMYPGVYLDDIFVGTVIVTIEPEYDESAAVNEWLYPGQTLQLTYSDWTPSNTGEYMVTACAQLATDGNLANDYKTKMITLS